MVPTANGPLVVRLVAKRLVEVAEVPVAETKVKFWRVDEPLTRRLARVARPEVVRVVKEPAPVTPTTHTPLIAKHPEVRLIPLFAVEVAPEERRRLPPVMVTPEAEERPPIEEMAIPPAKVEVAVDESMMFPPVIVSPLDDARPDDEIPAKVEVAFP